MSRIPIACALLITALNGRGLALQDPAPGYEQERAAREMLERAEQLARRGNYAEAQRTYPKIVTQFPGTAAAKVAERRAKPSAFLGWSDILRRGDSKNRVDIAVLDEGYEIDHQKAFDKLADDVPKFLLRVEPFTEYAAYFNFVRANLVSADSGVDGFGRTYDTALGARTIATIQGHVAVEPTLVHAMLGELPAHDDLAIVYVRQGIMGTASPGIATIGGTDPQTMIHEFGHAFARLSDEYATANYEKSRAHKLSAEFSGINVSASDDPTKVPWKHWIAAKHPSIGVYEGAVGQVRDAYRPVASGCVMNDGEDFCPVCREAIVLRIYSLVDPIDGCTPPPHGLRSEDVLVLQDPIELEVRVMEPETHALEVKWWILPEERFPASAESAKAEAADAPSYLPDRRERGPLPEIHDAADVSNRSGPNGVHKLRLSRTKLEKGKYRVICRVRDTTKLRSEAWPWVLADPKDLLESERAWWVRVD